jgi:hypothetical protein
LGSSKLPTILRKAGYKVVTHKTKYKGQQGVPDPTVIADCSKDRQILLTADGALETFWAKEIEQAQIAVVILTNNKDGSTAWGARLKAAKQDIISKLNQYKKPVAIRVGTNSRVVSVRLYGPKRAKLILI